MFSKENSSGNRKMVIESITPHKITLSILIRNYCMFREESKLKEAEDPVLMCNYRRDFCVLILRLLQGPEITFLELRSLLVSKKYIIPEVLIKSFDETLEALNEDGISCLLDIVGSLGKTMNRPDDDVVSTTVLARSSILGYHIRRFIVYFDKLTFSEVANVYEDFQKYYEEMQRSSKFVNVNEDNTDTWNTSREQWSRRQAELFIVTQAALLSNNEGKALSPPEMQKRIMNILKSNPDLSGAHFLSYLNYLRVDEYCGSVHSLMHCFDRNVDPDVMCFNDEKSKKHRFAALNLAILHYHFGHIEEALAALKESIKISQDANDNICLQHALSWLYRLTTVNKDKLIIHCILKSSELSLSYTASLGLQTFGQYGCLHTGKTYAIFETLVKSDMINCQHNYKDLIANNYSMKSSLWQLYGKSEMSSLWSQLLLFQNMDSLSPSKAFYGEGFCLAVCNIANHLLAEGEYDLANSVLDFAKRRFPNEPLSHIWQLCENIYIFTLCMYLEKWPDAEATAQKILVIDKWEGYLRLAEYYFYKRDYVEADNCVELLLHQYENDNTYMFSDRYYYVRAKILKIEIQFAMSHPDNVPPGVITVLNNCLIESQTSQLDYQSALIHLHLANYMLHMGMTTQALGVLDKCLVQILGHGGCYDRARAILLYAKVLIADSSKLEDNERKKVLLTCANMLTKCKDNFLKAQAWYRIKDVVYLQGNLYNILNMKSERNKCAEEFVLLEAQHTTSNIYTLVKYL